MRVKELSHPRTEAPPPGAYVLVELPVNYIPYAVLGLEPYKMAFLWKSDADYSEGYNAICDFQERLLTDMSQPIVDAVNRVYMAVRQGVAGEEFTAGPGDTPPELPVVPPPLAVEAAGGVLGQMYEARGILNAGWFGIGGQATTLADVVEALRAGDTSEVERVTDLLDTLQGAGSTAAIFSAVRSFFADGAALTADGLMLATMVGAAMAQAATAGLQSAQFEEMRTLLVAISSKLSSSLPASDATTVRGELQQVRELLTPEPYTGVED